MRRSARCLGTLVLSGLLLLALSAPTTPASGEPASEMILISRDLRGWLVPCDCKAGVLGGFARRATVVSREKPALLLDAGDLISQASPYDLLKLKLMLELNAKLGYAAVNVGRREAEFSRCDLQELARTSPVPLISANLASEKGRSVLRRWILRDDGDTKIGIVGLVSQDAHAGKGLRVMPPGAALRDAMKDLRPNADFVILLAALKARELAPVLNEVKGIDLVLGGWVPKGSERLETLAGVPCFLVQGKGQYLGEVTLSQKEGKLVPTTGRRIVLGPDIPSDKAIEERVHAFKRSLKDLDLLKRRGSESPYIGSTSCAACHGEVHSSWKETKHFRAVSSLTPEKGRFDPQCLACHTTAPGQGGYVSEEETPEFIGVGCESCHGPSRAHANAPLGQPRPKPPRKPRETCLACHESDHSKPFHMAERLKTIRHLVKEKR